MLPCGKIITCGMPWLAEDSKIVLFPFPTSVSPETERDHWPNPWKIHPNSLSNLLILVHSKFKIIYLTFNWTLGPPTIVVMVPRVGVLQKSQFSWYKFWVGLTHSLNIWQKTNQCVHTFGPFWDFSATSFSRKTYPTSLSSITVMKESTSSSATDINKPQFLQLLDTIFLFFLKYGN